MSAPRYLITGATGFLGRHLLEHVETHYPEITAIPLVRDVASWSAQTWTAALRPRPLIQAGLNDPVDHAHPALQESLDGIFHLAALVRHSRHDSDPVYAVNLEGTLNMVRLAAAARCRLVYVSTSGTVGVFDSRHEWADEHAPYQERQIAGWPYYDSKLKAERAARQLAAELGVELVIIRPPVLLGPGDHRFRSTGHIIRYLRGRLPFLIRGGMHFIDIRDAAGALMRAMQHPSPQPVYHLSGVACSIDSFFAMVQQASGVAPPRFHLPHPLALVLAKGASRLARALGKAESPLPDPVVVEMAGKYWDVRSRYAAQDLGFVNRNGQETLTDTVRWLYAHHAKLQDPQI
ncbi:MAG: NAD-dependent epimerase/dehydratase family protein [Candidatus Sericytochromatia bacterium]